MEPRTPRTEGGRGQGPVTGSTAREATCETAVLLALAPVSNRNSLRSCACVEATVCDECPVERFRQTTPEMIWSMATALRALACSWNAITPKTATTAVPTADQMA